MAIEEISFAPSSNIQSISYDEDTQTLYVKFSRGTLYRYIGVPGEAAQGFGQSMSAGRYLQEFIESLYESEPVQGGEIPTEPAQPEQPAQDGTQDEE